MPPLILISMFSGFLDVFTDPFSPFVRLQDLKDFMRQAGEVTFTNTHHIRSGEGIVEFGSKGDMEYALDKLDGAELSGRRWAEGPVYR